MSFDINEKTCMKTVFAHIISNSKVQSLCNFFISVASLVFLVILITTFFEVMKLKSKTRSQKMTRVIKENSKLSPSSSQFYVSFIFLLNAVKPGDFFSKFRYKIYFFQKLFINNIYIRWYIYKA